MSRAALVLACTCSLAAVAGACGDDGASTVDAATDGPPDAPTDAVADAPGTFALTSPMLNEGAMVPRDYTCNGANRSLPLTWTGTPIGTQSYALLLTDTNNMLIHWAIYDIPQARGGLPDDVDKAYQPADVPGARQAKSYDMQTTGYLGPCPPMPTTHTYRFELFALDVAALPDTTDATPRTVIRTKILEHDLASVRLTGTYMQP